MPYHVKRLVADLRGVRAWLITVGGATVAIAWVTTYMASFGLEGLSAGTLSPKEPYAPLSFIRVVDPRADIVQDLTSLDAQEDQLKTAGMARLIERMRTDDRLFLVLPLDAVTSKLGSFEQLPTSGRVVIGLKPPFVPINDDRTVAAPLWGPVPDVLDPGDGRLGPVRVRQVSESPLTGSYVAGTGYRGTTGREALLLLTPDQADAVGVFFPYSVVRLASSLTCYCQVSDLESLVREMTQAEQRAGTGRTYYAVTYSALIGPAERSGAVTAALLTVFPAATALSVCAFAGMAAWIFWRRCRYNYEVERRCGAGEAGLQARQQIILFLGITLPAVAGFILADMILQSTDPPPPWAPFGGLVAPFLALTLHATITGATAVGIHRLCRPWQEGLHG